MDNCSIFNSKSNAVCLFSSVCVKPFILWSGQAGSSEGGGIHWVPEAGDSSEFPLFCLCSCQVWLGTGRRLCWQKGKLWALSSWSLKLVLQISKSSSYYTAWCYPVGAFSGTLCVAGSSLSCVPGWVTSPCLRRKVVSEKESRVLFWDSLWPEPYRWIWDAEKKALMKSPV